eukprot:GHVQ01015787.1.p1 GENE.GHVQ01015787.1~~GHVQ01015787.1.p1  ORF type:complete len:1081 (-),score=197.26 GHVQ01015787.1:1492-4734(-)
MLLKRTFLNVEPHGDFLQQQLNQRLTEFEYGYRESQAAVARLSAECEELRQQKRKADEAHEKVVLHCEELRAAARGWAVFDGLEKLPIQQMDTKRKESIKIQSTTSDKKNDGDDDDRYLELQQTAKGLQAVINRLEDRLTELQQQGHTQQLLCDAAADKRLTHDLPTMGMSFTNTVRSGGKIYQKYSRKQGQSKNDVKEVSTGSQSHKQMEAAAQSISKTTADTLRTSDMRIHTSVTASIKRHDTVTHNEKSDYEKQGIGSTATVDPRHHEERKTSFSTEESLASHMFDSSPLLFGRVKTSSPWLSSLHRNPPPLSSRLRDGGRRSRDDAITDRLHGGYAAAERTTLQRRRSRNNSLHSQPVDKRRDSGEENKDCMLPLEAPRQEHLSSISASDDKHIKEQGAEEEPSTTAVRNSPRELREAEGLSDCTAKDWDIIATNNQEKECNSSDRIPPSYEDFVRCNARHFVRDLVTSSLHSFLTRTCGFVAVVKPSSRERSQPLNLTSSSPFQSHNSAQHRSVQNMHHQSSAPFCTPTISTSFPLSVTAPSWKVRLSRPSTAPNEAHMILLYEAAKTGVTLATGHHLYVDTVLWSVETPMSPNNSRAESLCGSGFFLTQDTQESEIYSELGLTGGNNDTTSSHTEELDQLQDTNSPSFVGSSGSSECSHNIHKREAKQCCQTNVASHEMTGLRGNSCSAVITSQMDEHIGDDRMDYPSVSESRGVQEQLTSGNGQQLLSDYSVTSVKNISNKMDDRSSSESNLSGAQTASKRRGSREQMFRRQWSSSSSVVKTSMANWLLQDQRDDGFTTSQNGRSSCLESGSHMQEDQKYSKRQTEEWDESEEEDMSECYFEEEDNDVFVLLRGYEMSEGASYVMCVSDVLLEQLRNLRNWCKGRLCDWDRKTLPDNIFYRFLFPSLDCHPVPDLPPSHCHVPSKQQHSHIGAIERRNISTKYYDCIEVLTSKDNDTCSRKSETPTKADVLTSDNRGITQGDGLTHNLSDGMSSEICSPSAAGSAVITPHMPVDGSEGLDSVWEILVRCIGLSHGEFVVPVHEGSHMVNFGFDVKKSVLKGMLSVFRFETVGG